EGLIVGAVFFSLLSQQPNVWHRSHGGWVECTVGAAVFNDNLEDTGVRGVWNNSQGVLGFVILIPHLTAGANHGWHGGINDDVGWDVQVGDAAVRVHHRQVRTVVVGVYNFVANAFGDVTVQVAESGFNSSQAVICRKAGFLQLWTKFTEDFWEVGLDDVPEQYRVRNLHHGGLQVRREQHAFVFSPFDLFCQECIQGFGGHESRIDDFAFEDLQAVFQFCDVAVGVSVTNSQGVVLTYRDRLLVGEEVVFVHGGNVGFGVLGPLAHGVRVVLCELFDRAWCTAIRVPFTQHRVDGRTHSGRIPLTNFTFFVGGDFVRELWQVKACSLKFFDCCDKLWHRCRDIWQLDDVGICFFDQLTQFGQRVVNLLIFWQHVVECCQDTAGKGDIPCFQFYTGLRGKRANDGQKGCSCQHRRFVGVGVNDL